MLVLGDLRTYGRVLEAIVQAAEALPEDRLPAPVQPPDAAMVERIAALVEQMGADKFQEREEATAELLKLGLAALEVAEGLEGAGPEAKARMARVRQKLEPPIPKRAADRPITEREHATTKRVRKAAERLRAAGPRRRRAGGWQ